MRIAQIAPLAESVPPALYGGTERVVSYLTEELVCLGHDVTLFASGDSQTQAQLVPVVPRALRLNNSVQDFLPYACMQVAQVLDYAEDFDILHFHIDLIQYACAGQIPVPFVTTLHGRLDLPDLQPFYRAFPRFPLISISEAQRIPIPQVNWLATVHHGLPTDLLRFSAEPGKYLAFLGRLSPEKGPEKAIRIAEALGIPLKIAAKLDPKDQDFYEAEIKPLLSNPLVEWIGEIAEHEKSAFLGSASALLFPVDWPEPFGLVLIEAMACGTPVVAFRRGSVPEIVEHGVTGFVVDTVEQAVEAARHVTELGRESIRRYFDQHYTATRMAQDYVAAYEMLLCGNEPRDWRHELRAV
jgi:glycosyltransferase involved in cell wall biosynthesis